MRLRSVPSVVAGLALTATVLAFFRRRGSDKDKKQAPSLEAHEEMKRMSAVYAKMHDSFGQTGLDVAAISSLRSWFHGVDSPGEVPWARLYTQFDNPFPKDAVRLLVIPLDSSPAISSMAAAVTAKVLALLPQDIKVFVNARAQYHCTVFHTSHPFDTRPDSTLPSSGLQPGDLDKPPHERRGPTEWELQAEAEVIRDTVASVPVPHLRLDRVVLAPSGTLLLTWVDTTNRVTQLRQELHRRLPGACNKQANIIHTSLFRILSDKQLPPHVITAVQRKCDELTAALHGTAFDPHTLWWVTEDWFSTITGARPTLSLPMGVTAEAANGIVGGKAGTGGATKS